MTAAHADGRAVRRPGRQTLSEGLNGHRNSLGVIRLVLATAVIFSHAFYTGGWGEDPFLALVGRQDNIGGLAVVGFFAASGYLIAKSGMKGDVVVFLWHRFLRIFPAFWLVLLVTALVVGPAAWLATGHSLASYFTTDATGPLGYLVNNGDLVMRQYGIYDIFAATPYGLVAGPVFNGSLWTLAHEWFCYLVIAVLVVVGVMSRHGIARWVLPGLTALVAAVQVGLVVFGVNLLAWLPLMADPQRVRLLFVFLVGSCFAVFSTRIRLDGRVAAVCAAVVVLTLALGWFNLLGLPSIAYLVLWLAARLPASVQWIGAKNDYSYGMYVYGFLVEQGLAFVGAFRLGYLPYVLLAVIIAACCAWLSWHLVEKRALQLKGIGPGRGVRHWVDRVRARA